MFVLLKSNCTKNKVENTNIKSLDGSVAVQAYNCEVVFEERNINLIINLLKFLLKMNILKFIGVSSCVLFYLSAQATAGCAEREKNEESPISDLYDNVRCGLTTQHERIRDGASTVGSSITASITSVGSTIRDGTTKAFDSLSKAALTTTEFIRDGLNAAIESSKSSLDFVRGFLAPKKLDDVKEQQDVVVGGNFAVETPVDVRIAADNTANVLEDIKEKVSENIIDNVDETLNLI